MHLLVVAAQPLAAARQPGHDRRDRGTLEAGDLFDGEPIQFEEDDGFPLHRRQTGERPGRALRSASLVGQISRIRARWIEASGPLRVEREEPAPEVLPAAVAVNGQENGVEPGPEARLVSQGLQPAEGPEQGLLEQVVTVVGTSAETPGGDRRLVVERRQES
jgi:hypothetical protein